MPTTRISELHQIAATGLPEGVVLLMPPKPKPQWKFWMVPGVVCHVVTAPSRFHRLVLGWLCGFKWERLP